MPWHEEPSDARVRLLACTPLVVFAVATATGAGRLGPPWAIVTPGIAFVLAAMGLARPALLRPLARWARLAGLPVTWLLSHAVMVVIYFGIVTPIAVVLRAFGHDPLHHRRAARPSWDDARVPRPTERYFRQH